MLTISSKYDHYAPGSDYRNLVPGKGPPSPYDLSPHQRPVRWAPESFPRTYSGRCVKLATHLYLVRRMNMREAVHPMSLRHGKALPCEFHWYRTYGKHAQIAVRPFNSSDCRQTLAHYVTNTVQNAYAEVVTTPVTLNCSEMPFCCKNNKGRNMRLTFTNISDMQLALTNSRCMKLLDSR